jgi:hypothetical protein
MVWEESAEVEDSLRHFGGKPRAQTCFSLPWKHCAPFSSAFHPVWAGPNVASVWKGTSDWGRWTWDTYLPHSSAWHEWGNHTFCAFLGVWKSWDCSPGKVTRGHQSKCDFVTEVTENTAQLRRPNWSSDSRNRLKARVLLSITGEFATMSPAWRRGWAG